LWSLYQRVIILCSFCSPNYDELDGVLTKVFEGDSKKTINPFELFVVKPQIASRHPVVIHDTRYIGFKSTNDGIINFRGIPYASSQQLSTPTPFAATATTHDEIDCTTFGPACWQDPVGMRMIFEGLMTFVWEMIFPSSKPGLSKAYGHFSEDCLNLNIWTLALDALDGQGQPRAVMVWIHGGAFKSGSYTELGLYNGTHLSQKGDVVVVSINYRFGLFALHLPDEGISNIAMQDQIFALQWIQQHISKFGGDPSNVTIFGESADGISVANLLASPKAKGLFCKAICQSGGGLSLTPEEYQHVFNTAAEQLKNATKGKPLTADHIRAVEPPNDLVKVSGKVDEALEASGTSKIGYLPLRDGTYVDA
jgi:para-nitrobenzyl esterase